MSRTKKLMVLGFAGLMFLVALAFLAFDPRVALGAAVLSGMCWTWLAGMAAFARAVRLEEATRVEAPAHPPLAQSAAASDEADVLTTGDRFVNTLAAIARSVENRNPYSGDGTARVMRIAMTLAETVGLDDTQTRALQLAVLLHDIGMSAAGEGIASTSGQLTTVEWALIRLHPRIGAEMLSESGMLEDVVPLVAHHHEHYDGSGYGERLAGEAIPLGARVLSVADAYVAMTSDRPYRAAMSRAEALDEITAMAGTQFDPGVVDAIVDLAACGDECLAVPA